MLHLATSALPLELGTRNSLLAHSTPKRKSALILAPSLFDDISILSFMSTAILRMQSLGPHCRTVDLDLDTTCEKAPTYSTSELWTTPSQDNYPFMSTPEYTSFPVLSTQQLDHPSTLSSKLAPSNSNIHNFQNKPGPGPSFSDYMTRPDNRGSLKVNTSGMCTSPVVFTANNAGHIAPHDPATISHLDTDFDIDYASPGLDTNPTFEKQSRDISPYATYTNGDNRLSKKRCDSLQTNFEPQSSIMPQPQIGRRRVSEYAEPGSARAVYLEKNRKAASKCRSKQKRQQEELVETARTMERRNKILKAEVEILKSDIRDLMEIVGQHSTCPDARLRLYVQREADRLAHNGPSRSSPLSGSSIHGSPSSGKTSSPEVS